MAKKPTEAIKSYFGSNILTLGKNENYFAKKVKEAFEINDFLDLWKVEAYIKYKTDDILDVKQSMQTLDFTMWKGEGDCEDHVRALKKVAETLGLKTFWWLVFTDNSYQQGHAMLLYITPEGYLVAQNYTEYFIEKQYKITEDDIKNETQNFRNAMEIINGLVFPKQTYWNVSWIIKTDRNEQPLWYVEAPTTFGDGDKEYRIFPNYRSFVIKYAEKLNTMANYTIIDYLIPAGIGIVASLIIKNYFK